MLLSHPVMARRVFTDAEDKVGLSMLAKKIEKSDPRTAVRIYWQLRNPGGLARAAGNLHTYERRHRRKYKTPSGIRTYSHSFHQLKSDALKMVSTLRKLVKP